MNLVIYLAAITGIDDSYYEAGRIDGATRWRLIRHITIPLMLPTISILTLLALGKIMYGAFDMIYAIVKDNGLLYPTVDVIDTYVFRSSAPSGIRHRPWRSDCINPWSALFSYGAATKS